MKSTPSVQELPQGALIHLAFQAYGFPWSQENRAVGNNAWLAHWGQGLLVSPVQSWSPQGLESQVGEMMWV